MILSTLLLYLAAIRDINSLVLKLKFLASVYTKIE
jgi:hypothetical protein